VRNPVELFLRSAIRALRAAAVLVAVPFGLLAAGAGGALAQDAGAVARVEPSNIPFGILGPVGLVAVAIGVLGMAAGVLRQRRKARVDAAEAGVPPRVAAVAEAVLAEHHGGSVRRSPAA
jgi:hypothetical protein